MLEEASEFFELRGKIIGGEFDVCVLIGDGVDTVALADIERSNHE